MAGGDTETGTCPTATGGTMEIEDVATLLLSLILTPLQRAAIRKDSPEVWAAIRREEKRRDDLQRAAYEAQRLEQEEFRNSQCVVCLNLRTTGCRCGAGYKRIVETKPTRFGDVE